MKLFLVLLKKWAALALLTILSVIVADDGKLFGAPECTVL